MAEPSDDIRALWSRVDQLLARGLDEPADRDELRAVADGFARLETAMTRTQQGLQKAQSDLAAAETVLAEQRRLIEEGPDGYLITTATGTIRAANAAIAEMLHLPRRFVIGKPLTAFVAQADLRAFRWRLNNVTDQRSGEWPLRLHPRHGDAIMVGVTVAPITRGSGAPDLRWLIRDISVRERAEALQAANEFTREILGSEQRARTEAERARQRLELLARVSGVLATSFNYPAALADITAIVLPLVGDLFLADLQSGEEFIPELSAHADSLLAERLRSVRAGSVRLPDDHPVAAVCRTGRPMLVERVSDEWLAAFAGSPEALTTWREVRLVSAVIVPIQSHRRRYGALTFGFGLSERRYDLAELGLFTDIGLRIALAFDAANLVRELEMEHQRKDEFLAMLAHELRNPLYAVTNALAALERASPEDRAHLAEILGRQSQHLAHLVNDLLDVSRIRFGLVSLRRRRLDLRGVVGEAVELARGRDESANLSISARLGTRPVMVEGDPDRLTQVLGNLLDNALKYTPAGGAVDVSVATEGNQAVLHVRDTGVGIALEFQPRVFDVFARANIQGTQPRTGLGLGLSVVRELVTQHGGVVGVESGGLGQGADFQIRIPLALAAAEPAASGEGRAPTRTPNRALSILVVEDNQDGRETLRMLLEQCGQRVRVARDGREAIEQARAHLPEVALVDIGLPDMDGYEVARAFRSLPGGTGIRLIALTGYSAQQDRSAAAGFDAHLVKPVTPESLLGLLSEGNHD
jgi:PAS domain S-box-containing protein